MRSMKLTGMAAVAIVALFGVTASSAFARTEPQWLVEAVPLSGTESIEAKGVGAQVLTATGVEVECSGMSGQNGNIIIGGSPGTDEEVLVYSNCTYKGKTAAQCEATTKGGGSPPGVIKTNLLSSELGFKAATGTETLTLFKPKPPATEFVSIEFKGTSCPLTETKVNGSVAVENPPTEGVFDVFTAPGVAIKQFFNATGVVTAKPKLTVTGGFVATYAGKVEVWLNGVNVGKKWGIG
jgi:hypothetical protein